MTPLLDTHQHLIYPNIAAYSWTSEIPVLADTAFTVTDYLNIAVEKGVSECLFMEAGADDADYQNEARFVASLVADPDNKIVGMIASCRPETNQGYDAWLDQCADLPVFGFRRILHVVDDGISTSDTFKSNVRKLGNRDLTFDMCFLGNQLQLAVQLAKACDNTRLILNHCGVPDIAGGELDVWRQGIVDLAQLPNVACKISGVMAYCKPGSASLDNIRSILDHVVDSFGVDRLVWGSDWPVVNLAKGMSSWIDASRSYLDEMPGASAEKIARTNALEIYHLG